MRRSFLSKQDSVPLTLRGYSNHGPRPCHARIDLAGQVRGRMEGGGVWFRRSDPTPSSLAYQVYPYPRQNMDRIYPIPRQDLDGMYSIPSCEQTNEQTLMKT